MSYDAGPAEAAERAELEESVARWRDKDPQVPVEALLADGNPVHVFVDASGTAQLVVVGGRRHSALGAMLLSPLGLQLLHHADCPVLIAHAPASG